MKDLEQDPFAATFTPDTDPIAADQTALLVLDRLEEVPYFRQAFTGKNDPAEVARFETGVTDLKRSMAGYLEYKKARGEEPLDLAPEAVARKQFRTEEDFARRAVKLYQADDSTFKTFLKENGDEELYNRQQQFMPPGESMRPIYVKEKVMNMFGFSQREIDSGFAEPQFREQIGAGEHEPTIDAISRWSLDKVNQYDRKHKIGKEANDAAVRSFLAMSDSEKKFEEALEKSNPKLSDTERTMIRAIRNHVRDGMETDMGHIRPLVKKSFNTYAAEEGTTIKFEGEKFANIDEAVGEMMNLDEKDFPNFVAMLAATAEAHGQPVPEFMTRVGKNFTRAVGDLVDGMGGFKIRGAVKYSRDTIKAAKKNGFPLFVNSGLLNENSTPQAVANAFIQNHDPLDMLLTGGTQPVTPDAATKRDRQLTDEEVEAVEDTLKTLDKWNTYEGQLRDWKGAVAKVKTGSPWHPSQWAYTLAGSLPEMGAMALGPVGMAVLFTAQTEKNMVEFQKKNPTLDPEISRNAASAAAAIYTLAAKGQYEVLFAKIPGINNIYGEFLLKLGAETVQESVQDLSFPIVQAAYKALDDAMPDVQLLGKDGELMKAIEQAPKNAFAMMPLVALGMGGQRAASYMDQRQLNKLLRDGDLLAQYGLTQEEIAEMKGMSLSEAVDYMEGRNYSFTETNALTESVYFGFDPSAAGAPTALTDSGATTPGTQQSTWQPGVRGTPLNDGAVPPAAMGDPASSSTSASAPAAPDLMREVTVSYDGDSQTFTVSNGVESLSARTSMEAVEAARSLNPEPFFNAPRPVNESRPATQAEVAALDAQAAAALSQPGNPSLNSPTMWAAPIRWNLSTDNISNGKGMVAHPELTQGALSILRAMGSRTPVRFSRRAVSKNARGVYWIKQRMIRVRRNDGVTTVFHEIGHAIEDQFLEGGLGDAKWVGVRGASPELARELDDLGNRLYQGTAPAGYSMSEGFAEYTRMLLEGVHDMDTAAPHTHKWFTDNVLTPNPHIAKEFAALRKKSKHFAEQGSVNRGRASIVRAPSTIRRSREGLMTMFDGFSKNWIDALYPLKDINNLAQREIAAELESLLKVAKPAKWQKERIKELRELQKLDPFETATSLSLVHDAVTKYMVEEQMRDFAGNAMGPMTSLNSILAPFTSNTVKEPKGLMKWLKGEGFTGKDLEPATMALWLNGPLASQLTSAGREALETHSKVVAEKAKNSNKIPLNPFRHGDRRTELALYLWAKRTLALYNDPRKGTKGRTFDSGLSHADALAIFNEFDSPLFELTADRLYQWNNSVLEYAAQASPSLRVDVDNIRNLDPGCYIPLFREFAHFEKAYASTSPAANTGQLTRRLKGSSRRIKDPFASMVYQARETVLRAHQRAVAEQMLKLRSVNGMGHLIFEVPPDKVPDAHRTVVQTLEAMDKALNDPDSQDALQALREAVERTGEAESLLTFWGEAYNPPNSLENPIIPIWMDGKRRWFEVDRNAYDALMGMEVFRVKGGLAPVFELAIGIPNRMFKLGTTGYRASFAMVTNPLRDLSTLYHNTRSTAKAPELAKVWGETMLSGFVAALSGKMLADTQWNQLHRRLGLQMASSLGQDTKHTEASARRLFQGKVMRTVHPHNILEYIRDVFQYAESSARITEMKLVAKDIGWDISQPLTREIAARLAVAAKQVTTDFTAAGRHMRFINQVMPFSNAQIQGIRSHVDAYNRNPGIFWFKGAMKAVAAVALWTQYKDEEWWFQMPIEEKYRFSYIPDPLREGEIIRIPRSFEVDGFFMAMPQAVLDAWHMDDPKRATEWAKHFLESFNAFKTGPVSMTTVYEIGKNRDTFFNRTIVPEGEVDAYKHEDWVHRQYGPHTSTLAIELGEMFGKSPRVIDHVIKKFTGGAGMDFVALFGRGPRDKQGRERESLPSDMPIIGTLWSPVGENSFAPRSITQLYKRREWMDGHTTSVKASGGKEDPTDRRMRLIVRDACATIAALAEVSKLELKTAERRKIETMRVQIAKEAVAVFDSKEGTRGKFTKWQREAQQLRDRAKKEAEDDGDDDDDDN